MSSSLCLHSSRRGGGLLLGGSLQGLGGGEVRRDLSSCLGTYVSPAGAMYESARGAGPREEEVLRSWSGRSVRRGDDRLSSSKSGFGGKLDIGVIWVNRDDRRGQGCSPPHLMSVDLYPLASPEQILNTPSRLDGIPAELEEGLRVYGCKLIAEAGVLLKQYVASTSRKPAKL